MKSNISKYLLIVLFLASFQSNAQTVHILFDATKAEMAGNADWVIDADLNNLGTTTTGKMVTGTSSFYTDSNPQGTPTPAQSGITASTPETFWNGALSAWAVDCAKRGYQVESLPYNDSITYGVTNHAKDLSHYNIFVVCEPNIVFSSAEKLAIVKFVKDGGRLFIIADHDISDRNGDGFDSPYIWNDLFTNNSFQANPFGITFDLQDYSQTTSNVANLATDTCLHGPMGNVTKMQISGGTTMTLNTANNPTVKGLIYKTGATNTGVSNVFFARANYGLGRVCAMGDSSPSDDGTGDANDVLYNGYTGDANGQHQLLLMNATIWLASNIGAPLEMNQEIMHKNSFVIAPNPSHGELQISFELHQDATIQFECLDITGRIIFKQASQHYAVGQHQEQLSISQKGMFLLKVTDTERSEMFPVIIQ